MGIVIAIYSFLPWVSVRSHCISQTTPHLTILMLISLHTPHLMVPLMPSIISHPNFSLPTPISSISTAAAASAKATVMGGWKVLVHGPAVRDEAQAQLKVSS